jgi:hypothetical protein
VANALVLRLHPYHYGLDHDVEPDQPLDPKWLDLAIQHDLPQIVCSMAKVKHPHLHQYLSNKWNAAKSKKDSNDEWIIARAMVDSNHPDAQRIILDRVRSIRSSHSVWYETTTWARLCARLSASAIPEFEAIIADPKTADRLGSELLDAIQSIRERSNVA